MGCNPIPLPLAKQPNVRLPAEVAMDGSPHIQDLADELLESILSFVLGPERALGEISHPDAHDPFRTNGCYVSRYGERSDLDRFRLVCTRFMRISTPRKFRRFVLRSSIQGFKRVELLLNTQLACHVRHFTYMVRPFYEGDGWSDVLNRVSASDYPLAQIHSRRIQDQRYLVDRALDAYLLRRAMATFPSLQQVKLLRLQDEADEQLREYIHRHQVDSVCLNWEPACTRAVANLSIALLGSNRSSIRFIGPQMCPESALSFLQTRTSTVSAVATRLTSIEINFHPTTNMVASMLSLSSAFHSFFLATENLTAIHLGFPSAKPLDLSLEQVLHHIHWKQLRTLSLQGWSLCSEELISLVRRHKRQLRNLRLLSIYLHTGGKWQDVLSILHDEMEQLERIDLRDIDYTRRSDAANTNGVHPPNLDTLAEPILTAPQSDPAVMTEDLLSFSQRPIAQRFFRGPAAEKLRALSGDDLGDDGVRVRREQRSLWEAWVLSSPRDDVRRWL